MSEEADRVWMDEFRPQYQRTLDRLIYVSTREADLLVVDLWRDPEGSAPGEAIPVVTVKPGVTATQAEALMPSLYEGGLAWETDPAPTPEERFMEAMRHGHLRARERMTGEAGLVPLPRL